MTILYLPICTSPSLTFFTQPPTLPPLWKDQRVSVLFIRLFCFLESTCKRPRMVKGNLGMLKITNFRFATLCFSLVSFILSAGVLLLRFLHPSGHPAALTAHSPGRCWGLGWLPWQGHVPLGFQDEIKSSSCTQEAESPRNREPFVVLINQAVCEDR